MQKVIFTIIAFIGLWACNNASTTKQANHNQQVTPDSVKFFPYTAFIKTESDSLAKNAFTFSKEVTLVDSSKTITTKITPTEFLQFANLFIQNNVGDSLKKVHYKETIFNDVTTSTIVINYTSKFDSMFVKNVDIHINANGDKFERVDMRAFTQTATTGITENYTWIVGKEMYIVRTATPQGGKAATTKVRITWKK